VAKSEADKMLVQEVFSFFGFAFVVGLALISNFFVHRMEVRPLNKANEVINKVDLITKSRKKTFSVLYLIRNDFLANLLLKELISI
jgi:hypothetical protein